MRDGDLRIFSRNRRFVAGNRLFVRRFDAQRHEMRVRIGPGHGLVFRFKESIDHDSATFTRGSPATARCFAVNDVAAGVDSDTGGIRKNHFAAVGNSLWIDGAMPGAQPFTGGTLVATGARIGTTAAACPINGDAGEKRFFAPERRGRPQRA